jgi:hypothetical protein
MFQFLVKIGLVGYFVLHQQEIAERLCLNKDKPELGCKGKCHLSKQLEKQEQGCKRFPSSTREIQETIVFFEFTAEPNIIPSSDNLSVSPLFSDHLLTGILRDVFHPPQG